MGGIKAMKKLVKAGAIYSLALMIAVLAVSGAAQAAAGVNLYTSFPGITVAPGESVSFPVDIVNHSGSSQRVALQVAEAPEGWETQLKGGSWLINDALVQANGSESIRVETDVPAASTEGTYVIRLSAQTSGGTTELLLNVRVTKDGAAQSELVTQYPVLQGPSGATFQFRVDLTNRSGEKQLYALSAEAPRGWEVGFQASYGDKKIASISLDENDSQGLDISITPPEKVKAGSYKIPIRAVSSGSQVSTELEVVITGTYDLKISTDSERLNLEATAGDAKTVKLKVTNDGSADLKGIDLTSSLPSNWEMTFQPETIDQLKAGETREVVAILTPSGDALAGDYAISVSAYTPEASSSADLRVEVETSILWGWIGVLIVAAVFAGLYYVFRKYGRR